MTSMKIELLGGTDGLALRERVTRRFTSVVGALPVKATSARAAFVDENGTKGGIAIRCVLEVRLPRRPAVHVEAVAATPRLAFDGALAKLERRLARLVETTRELRRRPKKYFAARRALTV